MSFIRDNNSDVLIVSFGGMGRPAAGPDVNMFNNTNTGYYDFHNFLPNNFSNVDIHFYADFDQYCYHKGIRGISTNIDTTTKYLKEVIRKYKKVIFIGLSGGGYSAILFGSLLSVDHIVTFYPTTRLIKLRPEYDRKYKDLIPYINKTTKYHLFGVSKPCCKCHEKKQCERICKSNNVTLKVYEMKDNIKELMRECKAYECLKNLIDEDPKPGLRINPVIESNIKTTIESTTNQNVESITNQNAESITKLIT